MQSSSRLLVDATPVVAGERDAIVTA